MRWDDFIITVAYFSIPVQILASLYQYPRLAAMPMRLLILLVLFALFIFLCGAGHLLRCMQMASSTIFQVTNVLTAFISITTALYLLPLIPSLMSRIDETMTELKKLNEDLEVSKQRLMTFMAFLCHEIRNPLFVITSNISFLEDESPAKQQDEAPELLSGRQEDFCLTEMDREQAVQAISQSADVMLRLVNDVLDISKLESGKLELQEHDFDLMDTLKGVVHSMTHLIKHQHQGNVAFETSIAPECAKLSVFADSVRFLQIVYNLLSNANKFTEQGLVRFAISTVNTQQALEEGLVILPGLEDEEHAPNPAASVQGGRSNSSHHPDFGTSLLHAVERTRHRHESLSLTASSSHSAFMREKAARLEDHVVLQISVQDTGPGIPQDQLAKLFTPYAQSKLANYRKHGGTGLGLAIVSKLTTAMGGNVRVQTKVGVGSTFQVYLPLQISHVPTLIRQTSSQTGLKAMAASIGRPGATAAPHLFVAPTLKVRDSISKKTTTTTTPSSTPVTSSKKSKSDQVAPLFATAQSPTPTPSPEATGPPPPPPATTPSPSPAKKTLVPFDMPPKCGVVLVVDDNDMNRKLLKRMLSHFHLEFVEAADGLQAVNRMKESRNLTGLPQDPQIGMILMDLSMPVMDGYEATATIRQFPALQDLPIVALTAATVDEGKQKAFEAGVTEYQTKPIKRDALYTLCQRYLYAHNNNNTMS